MSNFDKNDKRPLPIRKNKKVPGLFKDELGAKIITELVALRPKAYAYLDDDGNNHKKAKDTKKCVIKQKIMFQNFKDCLSNNENVQDHNKDLKAIIMMFIQKKLIKLHQALIMIKDYKHSIRLQHTHKEEMLLRDVKVKS